MVQSKKPSAKSKSTKPKTAATVASMTAKHSGASKNTGTSARSQGVGAYRRLVDEPAETCHAQEKRRSGKFTEGAATLCRYPVVKNLRQAAAVAREAAQAVVDTARGLAMEFQRRQA